MAKIFDIDFRKSTFIDSVSGTLMDNSGDVVFKNTEKGMSANFQLDSNYISMPKSFDLNNDWSIACVVKPNVNLIFTAWDYFLGLTNSNGDNTGGILFATSRYLGYYDDETNFDKSYNVDLILDKWYHFIATHSNGVINVYTDNVFNVTQTLTKSLKTFSHIFIVKNYTGSSNGFKGFIAKDSLYDHVLTSKERSKLYQEFLHSKSIYPPKRNFITNKPKDLSNERYTHLYDTWVADFSVDSDGLTNYLNTTVAGNIDNVSDGTTTKNNCVSITSTSGASVPRAKNNILLDGQKNIFTFTYYRPEDTGVVAYAYNGNAANLIYAFDVIGEWTTVTTILDSVDTQFQLTVGATAADDVIYFSEIIIKQYTGLVVSYNMKPSAGGVLVDISGNGNNGTISGIVATKDGMTSNKGDERISFTAITLDRNASCIFLKFKANSLNLIGSYGGLNYIASYNTRYNSDIYVTNTSILQVEGNTNNDLWCVVNLEENDYHDVVINANNGTVKTYVNGIYINTRTPTSNLTLNHLFGNDILNDMFSDIEIIDFRIYNRVLSLQEIKAYHNSFAKQTYIQEDFSNNKLTI